MTFHAVVDLARVSQYRFCTSRTSGTRISQVQGTNNALASNPVQLTVSNPVGADGGADADTAGLIHVPAPQSIQNPTSSVTRTDFETNALALVGGLTRALMLTPNEDPSVPDNTGHPRAILRPLRRPASPRQR